MKKSLYIAALTIAFASAGCSEEDFDSKYQDPSKVTTVSISNLMVGVFQKAKDYDTHTYNRLTGTSK